jgi:succinyl-diaminopimelate desuccinylase
MYREKIDAYIDSKKEEMLADLSRLVRIDSQKGEAREGMPFGEGPARALAEAAEMMKQYGLSVTNYDNYVVTGDFSQAEKKLDVLAHLDVVPVTDEWTVTQPFEPKITDGRIYGRGTADDKGPAIAVLYALRAIRELGIPMNHSVRVILGSDEECGSGDLQHYYGIEKEAPYTFTPDADFPVINIEKGRLGGCFGYTFTEAMQLPCILSLQSGDKSNVVPQKAVFRTAGLEEAQICAAASAVERELGVRIAVSPEKQLEDNVPVFAIEVKGKAAHASTPQDGKNALTAALRLISRLPLAESECTRALRALDQLFPYEETCGRALGISREEEQSGALSLCFSILTMTQEGISGTFDARLPIGCTEENTQQPVKKALEAAGFVMEDTPMARPHCVPGDSDFVKTLLGSYERYTGIKGTPLSTGGGTYVHNLERGVAFGCMVPEVDNHMHGDDEFMVIDQLLLSAKIFADAIIHICNEL